MPRLLKQAERRVRRVRDRLLMGKKSFPDINHLLHELRGQAFSSLDFGADHLVSVGCAGTWYFDWIRERFGKTKLHTGVEFYAPRPHDLPEGCDWVANTAGNMPEIESASADAVFSGQNLEHLWPDDVIGFFLESNRVLKPGGKLVVDSPNRQITSKLGWSHPEHTVELTVDEAVELCTLSGFDVTEVRGLWLCEDPETGKVLPFEQMQRVGRWPMKTRMLEGLGHPEQSFIWWIVATKSEREPERQRLTERMREIFSQAWTERCRRTMTVIGEELEREGWLSSQGKPGALLYGPYLPIKAGEYSASFPMKFLESAGNSLAQGVLCEVVAGDPCKVLASKRVTVGEMGCGRDFKVELPFAVQDTTFGVQFRVAAEEGCVVLCDREVRLAGWQQWQARAA